MATTTTATTRMTTGAAMAAVVDVLAVSPSALTVCLSGVAVDGLRGVAVGGAGVEPGGGCVLEGHTLVGGAYTPGKGKHHQLDGGAS